MSGLSRFTQKLFGQNSPNIAIFGSQASGTGQIASDVGNAQSLSAYTNGWAAATIGGQYRPTLEDFDALHYIDSYQINYMLQQGIPEYDAGTTYCLTPSPSIVKAPGTAQLYVSLIDNNIGNALTNTGAWSTSLNLGGSSAGTLTGDMTDAPQLTYSSSTVVNVSTGQCSDSTRSIIINNTSIKSINLATNGANGLDTGSLPSGASTLHYFIISGSSGVAGLASLSPTAPILPSGYICFRRIGSIKTNSSGNILPFTQNIDQFNYTAGLLEYSGGGYSTRTTINLAHVPSGIDVNAILYCSNTVTLAGSNSFDITLYQTNGGINYYQEHNVSNETSSITNTGYCFTNTSAQIDVLGYSNSGFSISTLGYIDKRGN